MYAEAAAHVGLSVKTNAKSWNHPLEDEFVVVKGKRVILSGFGTSSCTEKVKSPVVQVVQLESPLERLSDCRTVR